MCMYHVLIMYVYILFHLIDISISFNQSTYNINEDIGTVKLVLVLSNPSSTNTSVEIIESQGTATSKHILILL